ncbi:MAG TPA: hypothetical protein ENL04_00715 [Sulfuricurvum sp.]|nr:hypothetical protein [Sulfuricurvum sp.]
MSQHHKKILIRSIEQRIANIDKAFAHLEGIGTYDRDDFYFDEPEIREKYVQMNSALRDIRKYLSDSVEKLEN